MSRLVVVSNRVSIPSGGAKAGGLAVALNALMERQGGLWFGWSGKTSNDAKSIGTPVMVEHNGVDYATVDLTPDELEYYYNHFSNATLWPLMHSLPEQMNFDRRSLQTYRGVNVRLAEVLLPMLRPTDTIWIHDYHLLAMAAALRARNISCPIGFFLHTPFPSPDMLSSIPEAALFIRDMLSADLLGFQTNNDAENFCASAQRIAGAARLAGGGLQLGSRQIRVGAFPVEIDPQEFAETAERCGENAETGRLRRSLDGQSLILGVERMDPTKGLRHRLAGFRRLLESRPEWRRQTTLLQIAAESRQDVDAYQYLREDLERASGNINATLGEADWTPLRLLTRGVSRDAIAGFMREARIGLVTPLRDGMNLVAKEYVAAQDPDDPGVLVLSKFAGAARQLGAAILVNPVDPDEIADALDTALRMSRPERQDRWQACWEAIKDTSALEWGRSFVQALGRAGTEIPRSARPVRLGDGERRPGSPDTRPDIRIVSPNPTRSAG
ncbi:alpha,alpha-trehalose-phosphate synthase (UDP-forming) [Rhizosaccharibacter radicis]|uniref:Trehalose-6-phosphate synthase n=1 Tax=Rhizosaccharibacter radicis TaxID=2782605 RepID=A0ABT1VWC1_9PROT|nr:trehalose-6-phosphate synthase [Acetobacteraceae bacterium KSS12]